MRVDTTNPIQQEVLERGITRLCHFTPSRNLLQIAAGKVGVLATAHLEADERAVFNVTDLQRLDGRKTHISCSIEYPNAWNFAKKRLEEKAYPDWVVLLVRPRYLWDEGTLYCPRNAAAGFGRSIVSGRDGFRSLYAKTVAGTYDIDRATDHLHPCPTDQQAEVLVRDKIALADVLAVAVRDEAHAKRQRSKLRLSGLDPNLFEYVIAPAMYEKYVLSTAIRTGTRPLETPFVASGG